MKATEIMIGDWLWYQGQFNAFPLKVEQVTKRKIGYHAEPGENRMHYLRLNEVQPIPITPEFLERNGLRHKEEYEKYEWSEGYVEIWVILGDSGEEGEKQNVIHIEDGRRGIPKCHHNTIAFVHELQNALRLCKIEKEITP